MFAQLKASLGAQTVYIGNDKNLKQVNANCAKTTLVLGDLIPSPRHCLNLRKANHNKMEAGMMGCHGSVLVLFLF